MKEINLIDLLSKLIRDYEKMYETMVFEFEVKKKNNTFVTTNVDQKILKLLKVSPNSIIGRAIDDFPVNKESKKKLLAITEKAWTGKVMIYYDIAFTNKDILFVCSIKPIIKNGKIDKLEGHCAILDGKDFKGYLWIMINSSSQLSNNFHG